MLLATDLDGTLLPKDSVTVPQRTATALRRVDAAGIPVVFVTARPLRWMEFIWPHVGKHGRAVVSNGAITWDVARERPLSVHGIGPAAGRELMNHITQQVPGATFAIECLDGIRRDAAYCEPVEVQDDAPWGPIADLWDTPAVKLLVRHGALPAEEFRERTLAAVGDRANATWSVEDLIEISAPGVTKASALKQLCSDIGVQAEQVIAFGDMPNDLPMLEWAGTSYAVADAHPDVLAAADRIAPPVTEHGVALVMEELAGL